jgi:hypothetical protein
MSLSTKGLLDDLRERFEGAPVIAGLLLRIAQLWTRSYDGMISKGQTYAPDDPTYVWRLGATERHCRDCQNLDGQVHTASEWRAAGIRPQSPDLECGGWNCDCRLEPSDLPSSGDVV